MSLENRVGRVVEFHSDGTYALFITAMDDYTYTVRKNKLTTIESLDGTKETFPIVFDRGNLIVKNGNGRGSDRVMTRQSASNPKQPILGTWKFSHPTGATAFETFTKDGHMYFRMPLDVTPGTWSATSDHVTVQLSGKDAETSPYRIDGNILTITESGQPQRYRHAQ